MRAFGSPTRRFLSLFIGIPFAVAILPGSSALAQAASAGAVPMASPISAASAMQQLEASGNPLTGSVSNEKVSPNPVSLTLLDAINRGLKFNLGMLLSEQGNSAAAGARYSALSRLLPNVDARYGQSVQQINLAAYGFPPPAGSSGIIGPFGVADVRASVTDNVLDFQALNSLRAANDNIRAARYSYRNTRDLVVLAVGSSYLQALADSARVDAVQAQYKTAEALYNQAVDLRKAGMVAGIDVLRAQVEMQTEQQRLIVAGNEYDKQLLALARVIGLPVAQKFSLADKMPAPEPVNLTLEDALQSAYANRADYKQAEALVLAGEHEVAAARAERLPTIGISGDYGDIGKNLGNSHGTFSAAAFIRIPVFQGGKVKGDVMQAEAELQRRRAQYADLRGRIEYEVRTALMDVDAATRQLQVAASAVKLAREQVAQSRDRFAAGVTNNLEVVQAQETQTAAEENYISSLFAHNYAKLTLARALGVAEDATKKFLGGKQ